MLCLYPYQRVFYALASWYPSRRTRDNSKRRGLIACVFNTYGKLLSPNHLRSLPAAPHSDLSARQYKGFFQDMMFERLHDSTLSEDATEVIVQPLPYGTFKQNKDFNQCTFEEILNYYKIYIAKLNLVLHKIKNKDYKIFCYPN